MIGVGIAAGLGAGALWGLVFVAPRVANSFGMVDITAARFAVFGTISFASALLRPAAVRWPDKKHAIAALGLSVLGFSGYYLLLAFGVAAAGTEVPSLIVGTIPIWLMLIGRPAGLQMRSWLPGLLFTGSGVVLMMWVAWSSRQVGPINAPYLARGVALAIGAMASWTIYGLLNASWLQRHPELHAADWANWLGMATGGSAVVLWLMAGSEIASLRSNPASSRFIWIALAIGFGSSWLATVLWNVASRRLPAGLCGQLIVSETLFALLYSFVWDGRWPHWLEWTAALSFVAGMLMSIRAHQRSPMNG